MLMVLVAFIAFAFQSCSKSEDNVTHNISWKLYIQDQGDMSDELKTQLENEFAGTSSATYANDEGAKTGTEVVAKQIRQRVGEIMYNDKSAVFTVSVVTTRVSDNKQVCKWDVIYDKGVITMQQY